MNFSDNLQPGDKIYYPSVKGMALLCDVIDLSEDDVLVSIDGKQFYLPKESVDSHGIIINEMRARSYVAQRIEDPENRLVYLRYMWNDNWVDRLYGSMCESLNRIDKPLIFEASDEAEEVLPDDAPTGAV